MNAEDTGVKDFISSSDFAKNALNELVFCFDLMIFSMQLKSHPKEKNKAIHIFNTPT